jgi:hypothetical protein
MFEHGSLVETADSHHFCALDATMQSIAHGINHPDWEIQLTDIELGHMVGEGEYGVVHYGRWHRTPVAIKVLLQAPG